MQKRDALRFSIFDFFAVIRECYNNRADDSAFNRLTFALIGVATPTDLIQAKQRTPFNIGRAIQLTGFQLEEAAPLLPGLSAAGEPEAVLQAILHWTGGQPFLTQKVCQLVVQTAARYEVGALPPPEELVEQVVRTDIIDSWEVQDEPPHLKTIRDRIRNNPRAGQLLEQYQQVVSQGQVAQDGSPKQVALRLSGLVVERGHVLRVYNPIYRSVFDSSWIGDMLASIRPYGKQLEAWAAHPQDDSLLLQGVALAEALDWAEDRSLGKRDYQFLVESQKLGLRRELADINAELLAAQTGLKKVRRRTRWFSGLGIGFASAAVFLAILAGDRAVKQTAAATLAAGQRDSAVVQKDEAELAAMDALETVDDLQTDKEGLEADRNDLESSNQSLVADNEGLLAENRQVTEEVDAAVAAQATAEEATAAAESQAVAAEDQAVQIRGRLAGIDQELTAKNSELETVQAQTGELRAERDGLNTEIADLQTQGERIENALQLSIGTLGLQRFRNVFYALGGLQDSLSYLEGSLANAKELKNRRGEGYASGNLGEMHHNLGDYPKALENHQAHLAIAREIQDRYGEGQALGNIGEVFHDQGENITPVKVNVCSAFPSKALR